MDTFNNIYLSKNVLFSISSQYVNRKDHLDNYYLDYYALHQRQTWDRTEAVCFYLGHTNCISDEKSS